MDKKTKAEILEFIESYHAEQYALDTDITLKDLELKWGVGRTTATRRIRLMVADGLFTEHLVSNANNKKVLVWRMVHE